jgi:hypothetical protein
MPEIDWSISKKAKKEKLSIDQISGMAKRAVQESERFNDATDSSFYCSLVFQTSEQREAFVEAMKWIDYCDDEDPCYIDGVSVARSMGIALPATPPVRQQQTRKRWEALTEKSNG